MLGIFFFFKLGPSSKPQSTSIERQTRQFHLALHLLPIGFSPSTSPCLNSPLIPIDPSLLWFLMLVATEIYLRRDMSIYLLSLMLAYLQ